MNRKTSPVTARPATLIETLEPRIAPAGLNELKFTSVTVGGSILLDASGGANDFQGLSTAFGAFSGSYLLYLNAGKAVVFTTDLNGDGILDPGEITGIALAPDSQGRAPNLTLFSDVHGDIVTNLNPGHFVSTLTDLDNNPNNGRDGRILLDNPIGGITLRTLTAADIDSTVPGNTLNNRVALTHFSIYGNIISGGDFGGLSIDTSGTALLTNKFVDGNIYHYSGSEITIDGIMTGSAASNQPYHFTQRAPQVLAGTNTGSTELVNNNVEGTIRPFTPPAGEHGGDISNISAVAQNTVFSIGHIASGDGGTGARGGNINNLVMHGDLGGYEVLAGNGGAGASGGVGGSIINFNDLATTTGQVYLHTGNGGRGTLGNGGVGGTATFATTQIAADLEVVLGNGGDGFSKGGNGSGITNTLFNTPDVTLQIGQQFIGTWHDIGDVGNTKPFNVGTGTGVATYSPEVLDFDGDGFGDAIFTTTNPDQVVVVFGDGFGSITDNLGDFFSGVTQKTVVLKVPGGGTPAVTVGDFNGDGKPDIAVASGNVNNFGGINVYLNQIGNNTLNPVNAFNYTHNPLGDHPFSIPSHSAIPLLTNLAFFGQSGAILALAAGDYNGDGITDIAYAERVQDFIGRQGQTVGVLFGEQATSLNTDPVLVGAHVASVFVNGSLDNGLINNATNRPQGTGYFYANPGPFGGASAIQIGGFFLNTGPVDLHATSMDNNNAPRATVPGGASLPVTPEIVVTGIQTRTDTQIYTAFAPNPITHIPQGPLLDGTRSFQLNFVDSNRNFDGVTFQETNTRPQIQDFTIVDADQDGHPDLLFLSNVPQSFLSAYRSSADARFTYASAGVGGGNDNAGIFLGNFPNLPPVAIALASTDPTRTGRFDGFAITNLITDPIQIQIREFRLLPLTTGTGDPLGFDTLPTDVANYYPGIPVIDRQVNTLDGFYRIVPTATNPFPRASYGLLAPDISDFRFTGLYLVGQLTEIPLGGGYIRDLTENGISIYSGNGGNSSNGVGGNAGNIGDGTLAVGSDATTTASIQLRYTPTQQYAGSGLLRGGNGGNGFAGGGQGGNIEGVTARYNPTSDVIFITVTSFQAGDGGDGIGGDGGNGGRLNKLSIENGPNFYSGNGGSGLHGGAGGAILGNQVIFDTSNISATLVTGNGGQGSLAGGAGGTISRWQTLVERFGGFIDYSTGGGGSAAGGTGGAGGGILDSSLDVGTNRLNGSLSLVTGVGGNGLAGGAGGLIRNFLNQATEQSAIPIALTVLAGNGGVGVSSVGGAGGAITGVQSNATGLANGLVRVIAGAGGDSYGAEGGVGGSVTNVNVTATSAPLVVAAGAGGDGLTVGGLGGSVVGTANNAMILDSAAQLIGKLVIVAGKGGDAYSALRQDILLPGDNDVNDLAHALLAFGGTSGQGGNGGDIANIRQPVSTQTAVDIIAGNGGSTVNASSALSPQTGVGRGGSISNIQMAGTLGSVNRNTSLGQIANPPIKSYSTADVNGNTTSSLNVFIAFLTGDLLNPDGTPFVLTDAVGNVGMVAGAAGNVSGGQPAQDGANGSVTGITASSILSIVAGSVDRVAPVAQISNILVTNPDGVLGADKSINAPFGPNGQLDYYNVQGINVANLEAGYRLIDGAIFASQIVQTPGQVIVGPRVFSPQ